MANAGVGTSSRFVLETTFVLFFLSVDFGQNVIGGSFDIAFLGITVIALAVLPYYLPSNDGIDFMSWVTGRSAIVMLGLVTGVAFGQFVGVIVPEFMRYLPLVMATVSGFASCYVMYANLFRLSYAD